MKYLMIIDDSITVRSSVEYTIQDLGFSTMQAEDGADAIQKIKKIKESGDDIVLCITDVNMPVMNGITFVKEFRKIDRFTPVLILSTVTDKDEIKSGMEAGASGWVIKPFLPEELVNTVTKLIK